MPAHPVGVTLTRSWITDERFGKRYGLLRRGGLTLALHRDIFWLGKQWTVTGFGVQAVDQRLRGVFDIEAAKLWDDDLVQSRRAKPGVNVADFDEAISIARARYHDRTASPPEVPPATPAQTPQHEPQRVRPLEPYPRSTEISTQGASARFSRQWRVPTKPTSSR